SKNPSTFITDHNLSKINHNILIECGEFQKRRYDKSYQKMNASNFLPPDWRVLKDERLSY
ncbi:hypothetical protein J1779_14095, partial [Rahnella sp. FC061912-K]|uniref:hypothetical protein n=1 Tax=Rahnella rivi TaxID=2816249 RepID=UPI001C25D6BE